MKTKAYILDYITKHKRVRTKQLRSRMTITDRALYKALASLVKEKKLKKIGVPPKVFYIPYTESFFSTLVEKPITVTKQQQIEELTKRVTPILNVDVAVYKDGKFLLGRRSKLKSREYAKIWLFPGGRMRFDETPQDAALRIMAEELPGLNANVRTLISAVSDKGHDARAYGITLYYLCDYVSGTPKPNYQLDEFKWVTYEDIKNDKNVHNYDKGVFMELDAGVKRMHSNVDEVLVEVSRNNKRIGKISKRSAHNTTKRYHRAAHIVVFTSKGNIVLHQRALTKVFGAGRWDIFGGHQVLGQSIEQTALSELTEELGVAPKLEFHKSYLYQSDKQNEYSHLFHGVSDGPYGFDKNEVAQILIFNCQDLLDGKYDKGYDIIPHVKKYVRDLEFVWKKLVKD